MILEGSRGGATPRGACIHPAQDRDVRITPEMLVAEVEEDPRE